MNEFEGLIRRASHTLNTTEQEPITGSVHLHCIRAPTYAQIDLFLDMCFPRTSVSTVARIRTEINAEKNGGQSEVPHPSSVFLNHFFPFGVDFGHMRTAAESDVRGKQI